MPIGAKLAIVIGLFLVAGLLLGWGSGSMARGAKQRGRARPRTAETRPPANPTYVAEVSRWDPADTDANGVRIRPQEALPEDRSGRPAELPRESGGRRRRGLPRGRS